MSQTLASRLKTARSAVHPPILQKDIAKRFKVTPGAVSLWESGGTEPDTETLVELAKLYKVSVDYLVGLQDSPRPLVEFKSPLHTVPVVSSRSLAKWRLELEMGRLQTEVAYPTGTAAAMLVSTDALTSTCPTGCYAVISKSHKPTPGSVVLADTGKVTEPILRRYVEEGSEHLLMADDARWPTVRLSPSKIVGTVVEVTVRKRLM